MFNLSPCRSAGGELTLDENWLLSLNWRFESTSPYNKCLTNFLKKTPMKAISERSGMLVFVVSEHDMERAHVELIAQKAGGERGTRRARLDRRLALHSEDRLRPADFRGFGGEAVSQGCVTFASKVQMVEALRDPALRAKYPNLVISRSSLIMATK